MDPGTVIALCKENIQPLRHGRNATQLGTALRAQEDVEAQQLLQQEKQMYEDSIKNYIGDDPLENWYEYISWVEQSYPKSGHESPLARLLQQCLTNFEKEIKYHQDRRFIRLWINYISIQKNPLELYQLLYNNGIGTMVADLYRAWAFELEQVEDYKRADEVYMIGLNCRAEPKEELDMAHKNFQLAVARKTLGRNEERNEVSLVEQRQAFSSLKAIRAGRRVASVRTGHRVRDYLPGALPQQVNSMNQHNKPNAAIQIYQDDAPIEMKGSSILDHVPIEEAVHKENTIKPGPWNSSAKKYPLISSAIKPSFKVHEDTEEINMDKIKLFPNHVAYYDDSKYEDHYAVPVFVPDVPNPNIILKTHYPKDLVYANNKDMSMEEIRAQKYLQRELKNQPLNGQMQEANNIEHSLPKHNEMEHQMHHNNRSVEEELQRQNAERQRLEQQQREAEMERQRLLEQQQREAELKRQRLLEQKQRAAELKRQRQMELEMQRQQREAEMKQQMMYDEQNRLEAERLQQQQQQEQQQQHQQQQQSLQTSSFMSQHHSSTTDEQHLLGQSMTVNTKEAISAVQDLWQSPSGDTSRMLSPAMHRMQSNSQVKLSFDIHMDSSMTQNVMVSNKLHHQQQQQQQNYNSMQAYNDQENHHFQHSYSNHEAHNSYGSHSYHYQMQQQQQQHLEPHMQPPQPHHPHLQSPHHHQALMQQHHHQHMQPPPPPMGHHQTSPHAMHHQSPPQHHAPVAAPQHHYPPQHMQMPVQHMQQPHMNASQHVNVSHHISPPQHLNNSQHMNPPQHMNTSQHINSSQHMNTSQHMNASQQMNASQHINSAQHMNASQHMSAPQHMNTSQHMNASQHMPHIHHHQQQPHLQHPQQPQHMYNNVVPNNMGYPQPFASPLQSAHSSIEQPQKQMHFSPYVDPAAEGTAGKPSPYRMPPELPHIKSPGMNRRDLKYLENAENKENAAVGLDYNGAMEDHSVIKHPQHHQQHPQQDENHLFYDESLGISPLPGVNETCYTETFNRPLIASTPMTNHFKYKSSKEAQSEQQQQPTQHQHQQMQQQPQLPQPPQQQSPPQQMHQQHQQYQNQPIAQPPLQNMPIAGELGEKLSVIMESTREYVSSSSASSGTTRTGFTITRDELPTIKEQSTIDDTTTNERYMSGTAATFEQSQQFAYEQKMRAQIQAVHAQSPRTVQRNVDQITTEIKNNCDLRKSISFNGATVPAEAAKEVEAKPDLQMDSTMDCEYHEPMEQEEVKEEPPFEIPKGDINPFDKNLIAGLLRNMKFPLQQHVDGYVKLSSNLVKFVPSSSITLGNDVFDLDKCLGKGTYGTVFKGTDLQTRRVVALKTQKPSWVWEFYIAREIKTRLTNPHMLRGFMDVQSAYIAENGSVLVMEFSKYGTLLEVTNKIKISTGKPLSEPLAIFFTIEMLQIVEYLHKCQIIHADIKPDNFLLMHMPSEDVRPTIQLIDYGCSIDMSLLPEGTKFTQIIKTEDFTCIEMQTGKPWTYQTDLYCLAASSHCLLFGNYMRVSMSGDKWYINSKLPRYAKKAVWEQYFTELLNIESCENLPDLAKLRNMMEEALAQMPELQTKYRQFSNVLNHR